ncbi:MAG: DMT family transporter [Patescibacteria group bacterium]
MKKLNPFYKISRERSGELFIFFESVFWGALPVVSVLASGFISPILVAAWSTLFAAIFFSGLLTIQKKWKEILIREAWRPIFFATVLIAVIYFVLFFLGLRHTSAGNAAIILQMEVWFSFIFFGLILRKEKYTPTALIGAALMFGGVLFVLFSGKFEFNRGDLLILLATVFPPAGNYFQQIARKKVSAATLLFIRSAIGAAFLFLIASFFEMNLLRNFSGALPFLVINGCLLFGVSRIFWIEGIHRISVAKAISLNTFAPVFALIYAFFFLHEIPTVWQLMGLPLVIIGAILIVRNNFLRDAPPVN